MKPDENLCKKLRVLVVDDHMLMRNMISQNLRSIGLTQIESAANGQDAWEEIKLRADNALPYHIIFLDWHMPELDGISVLKMCRADKRFDRTAIVMLTAEQEQKKILEAIESGATSYVVKPVSRDSLERNIEKIIGWLTKKGLQDFARKESEPLAEPKTETLKKASIPNQLRQELKPVVAKGIENIFSEMFKVQIVSEEQNGINPGKDLVCIGRLHQRDILIVLRFLFDEALLTPLLQQLYAPQFLKDPKVYEDAACEIVNILCSQIKAFMNSHGYNLQLDFPAMGKQDEKCKEADSIMDVRFSLNDEQFAIDLAADGKRA